MTTARIADHGNLLGFMTLTANFFFNCAATIGRDESGNVAAHGRDLPHQCGGDRADRRAMPAGIWSGSPAPCRRSFLPSESRSRNRYRRAGRAPAWSRRARCAATDDEVGKGDALNVAACRTRDRSAGFLQHDYPFIGGEQRRFSGMQADGENQPVKKPRGMRHNVEMTIGDRIKRACVKSGACHGFWGVGCCRNPEASLRVRWVQHLKGG